MFLDRELILSTDNEDVGLYPVCNATFLATGSHLVHISGTSSDDAFFLEVTYSGADTAGADTVIGSGTSIGDARLLQSTVVASLDHPVISALPRLPPVRFFPVNSRVCTLMTYSKYLPCHMRA